MRKRFRDDVYNGMRRFRTSEFWSKDVGLWMCGDWTSSREALRITDANFWFHRRNQEVYACLEVHEVSQEKLRLRFSNCHISLGTWTMKVDSKRKRTSTWAKCLGELHKTECNANIMLDHHISIGHNALRLKKDEFSIQEDRMFLLYCTLSSRSFQTERVRRR